MALVVVNTVGVPDRLRGLLALWLTEVDTCVYVGECDPRTRGMIWKNVQKHAGEGRVTMAWGMSRHNKIFGFCSTGEGRRYAAVRDGVVTSVFKTKGEAIETTRE